LGEKIEEILRDAGITDALYTVHIKEFKTDKGKKALPQAVVSATLNALFDAGGVVNIE